MLESWAAEIGVGLQDLAVTCQRAPARRAGGPSPKRNDLSWFSLRKIRGGSVVHPAFRALRVRHPTTIAPAALKTRHLNPTAPAPAQTPHLNPTAPAAPQTPYLNPADGWVDVGELGCGGWRRSPRSGGDLPAGAGPPSRRSFPKRNDLSWFSLRKIRGGSVVHPAFRALRVRHPMTIAPAALKTRHLNPTAPATPRTPHLNPTAPATARTPHLNPADGWVDVGELGCGGWRRSPRSGADPAGRRWPAEQAVVHPAAGALRVRHLTTIAPAALKTRHLNPTAPAAPRTPHLNPAAPAAPQTPHLNPAAPAPAKPHTSTSPTDGWMLESWAADVGAGLQDLALTWPAGAGPPSRRSCTRPLEHSGPGTRRPSLRQRSRPGTSTPPPRQRPEPHTSTPPPRRRPKPHTTPPGTTPNPTPQPRRTAAPQTPYLMTGLGEDGSSAAAAGACARPGPVRPAHRGSPISRANRIGCGWTAD
jgi:hypothetical protein